jgi:hypothetical protein
MLGAGFSWLMCGKAPPEMPAFQPYRGKPAVRNDREGRGNDGIIRSPGSRLDSTRLRGAPSNGHPYRDQSMHDRFWVQYPRAIVGPFLHSHK